MNVLGITVHNVAYIVFKDNLKFRAFHADVLHLAFEVLHLRTNVFDEYLVVFPVSVFVIPDTVLIGALGLFFLFGEGYELVGLVGQACLGRCRDFALGSDLFGGAGLVEGSALAFLEFGFELGASINQGIDFVALVGQAAPAFLGAGHHTVAQCRREEQAAKPCHVEVENFLLPIEALQFVDQGHGIFEPIGKQQAGVAYSTRIEVGVRGEVWHGAYVWSRVRRH